jgi:glyoxylase-like metal-dependent hydrolase (beta-lactamase superfamily II)
MIESNVLQPVPGTKGTDFFPYIRKIDLMSSNSYVLSGEDQIALIDPGALDDQFDFLSKIIITLQEKKLRPVVIYLTHTHLDHCFQLKRCRDNRELGNILVAVQDRGAKALEEQDAKMTLAGLLGKELSKVSVDIRLLSNQDIIAGGERELCSKGVDFAYLTRSQKIHNGLVLNSQTISLGKDDQLEIYPMPGHSPDSICLRVGGLLFVGDLFFAPNPGMAGAYGWNQSDLLNSIQSVLWILEQKNVLFCCSGHGRAIDADTARRSLRSMYQDVISLSGLEEITPLWARNTAIYAENLMRELERLFTILTGRLAYISHILAELEEIGEANYLQSLIDVKQIDDLFMEFNRFVMELKTGTKLDWDLVHKAGQIVGKLDMVFEKGNLGSVFDLSLLKRTKRLLNDFAVTYRGFRPNYYVTDVDINMLIRDVLGYLKFKTYEEEAILEAEKHEDYLLALRTRIACIDIFEKVALVFIGDQNLPLVRMDKERFVDAMIDLLERLSNAGAKGIWIIPRFDEGWVAVNITMTGSVKDHPLGGRALRFFERIIALCGGLIRTYTTKRGHVVVIEFLPSANS